MNWSELWTSIMNTHPSVPEIALRLACAMLVGLVIGTEREYTHRPAGMRTHILVALGACAVSITGELLFHQYNTTVGAMPDPARLSAQVITGVGFLGAGTIMREGINVKGLTTAASLWAVACLGIAAGFGYYLLAVIGMALILITLTLFEWIQHKLVKEPINQSILLETNDLAAAMELVNKQTEPHGITLSQMQIKTLEDRWRIQFHVRFSGSAVKTASSFLQTLAMDPAIQMAERSNQADYAAV